MVAYFVSTLIESGNYVIASSFTEGSSKTYTINKNPKKESEVDGRIHNLDFKKYCFYIYSSWWG